MKIACDIKVFGLGGYINGYKLFGPIDEENNFNLAITELIYTY